MENRKNKRKKKIRNYIIICAMLAVILSVSTYAWFIGLQDVKVSAFDVEIKAADSLMLSLTGGNSNDWASTVTINVSNYSAGNLSQKNVWGDLIPLSTDGKIDSDSSTMKLYEKASFTASPTAATTAGGYRLLASRVANNVTPLTETNGYVAFDLFIKNFSGEEYYAEYNPLNEEAIYLTTDSQVTVAADGVANTGIENSIRVGFAQIARGKSDIAAATIMDATCDDSSEDGITGICVNKEDATIWEPNDTDHVQGAISWFTTSCKNRTGADITLAASYSSDTCSTLATPTEGYYTTYAVNSVIEVENGHGVDAYDGLNNYNATIGTGTNQHLTQMDYFTDTEKNLTGTSRPTFFTLAPNSVTKVRVYVWIEGQDIDNYDYAAAGKKVSVSFGFSKQRYTTNDVNYTGPTIDSDRITITQTAHDATNITQALCTTMNGAWTETGETDNEIGTCTTTYGDFRTYIESLPAESVYTTSWTRTNR